VKAAIAAIVVLALLGAGFWFFRPLPTELVVEPPVAVIGMETPVRVLTGNPRGIQRLTAYIEQDGQRHRVHEALNPPHETNFSAGKKQAETLKDGKATLIIEAEAAGLLGRTDTCRVEVQVVTAPPRVSADNHQHYINQGGSELVTFTVSGYWTEAGVRVGEQTFRSFPLPGKGSNERFSLFAFSWDTPANTEPIVYARNPAGAEATARFWQKVFPKRFRSRELPLSDAFLEKVVNQIDPGGTGDLLTRFLTINGEMRRRNNSALADLRHKTEERFLWSGPFLQLSNSKVESQFADIRSYLYQGKNVDQQTHLGFDLSVVKNVPVVAANDGKVIFAGDLGIYGNCIVVDHGYGLQSIYGHLSSIGVKPGDEVKRSQEIGKSGDTGLAGGDHLHFTMQVDGVQVNPVEWWDGHWIQDRILSKLPAAQASRSE
jgi:murein DD-endopeptidase MepM/ murein hydrolase activator NlpD